MAPASLKDYGGPAASRPPVLLGHITCERAHIPTCTWCSGQLIIRATSSSCG